MDEAAYQKVVADTRYKNTVRALRRAERRLSNSMAHTPKPRPADMIRWQAMKSRVIELRTSAERQKPGDRRHASP